MSKIIAAKTVGASSSFARINNLDGNRASTARYLFGNMPAVETQHPGVGEGANLPHRHPGVGEGTNLQYRRNSIISYKSRAGSPLKPGKRSTSPPSNLNTLARQKVLMATLMSDLRQEDLDSVVGIIRVQDPDGNPDSFQHIALNESKIHSFVNSKGSPPSVAERLLSSRSPEARTVFICCEDHESRHALMLELICQIERNSHPANATLRCALNMAEEKYTGLLEEFETLKKENESLCSGIIEVKERGAVYTREYAKKLKQLGRILEFERKKRAGGCHQLSKMRLAYAFQALYRHVEGEMRRLAICQSAVLQKRERIYFKAWNRLIRLGKMITRIKCIRGRKELQRFWNLWKRVVHKSVSSKYLKMYGKQLMKFPSIISQIRGSGSKGLLVNTWKDWISYLGVSLLKSKIIRQTLARMRDIALVKALNAWKINIEQEKTMRLVCSRVLRHWLNTLQRKAWNRWCQQMCVRSKCTKILRQMMSFSLSKAWNTWRAGVDQKTKLRSLCHKVLARISNLGLAKAMTQWHTATESLVSVKAVHAKTVSHLKNLTLSKAWNKWVWVSCERTVFQSKMIQHKGNRLLYKGFKTWHKIIIDRTWLERAGLKIMIRMKSLLLSSVWKRWLHSMRDAKRLKHILRKEAVLSRRRCLSQTVKAWWYSSCTQIAPDKTISFWRRIIWYFALQDTIRITASLVLCHQEKVLSVQQSYFAHFRARMGTKNALRIFRGWVECTRRSVSSSPFSVGRWHMQDYIPFKERSIRVQLRDKLKLWMAYRILHQFLRTCLQTILFRRRNRILRKHLRLILLQVGKRQQINEMDANANAAASMTRLKRSFREWCCAKLDLGYRCEIVLSATLNFIHKRLLANFSCFLEYFCFQRRARRAIHRCSRRRLNSLFCCWKEDALPKAWERKIGGILMKMLSIDSQIRAQELSV